MKCNYNKKVLSQLATGQKNRMLKEIDMFYQEYLKKECQQAKITIIDNFLQLAIVVLHDTFKFGSERIQRFLNELNELVCQNVVNDDFYKNIEIQCKKIMTEKTFDTYFNKTKQ